MIFFVMRLRSAVGGAIQTTQLQWQLHQKTPQSTQKKTCTLFSAPDDLYKPASSKSLSFSTGHSGLHRCLTAFTHSHLTLYGRSDKVCALLFAINLFHNFFAILTTDVVQS